MPPGHRQTVIATIRSERCLEFATYTGDYRMLHGLMDSESEPKNRGGYLVHGLDGEGDALGLGQPHEGRDDDAEDEADRGHDAAGDVEAPVAAPDGVGLGAAGGQDEGADDAGECGDIAQHVQRVPAARRTLEAGVWDPRVCVPEMAWSDFSNCKFCFFPAMVTFFFGSDQR